VKPLSPIFILAGVLAIATSAIAQVPAPPATVRVAASADEIPRVPNELEIEPMSAKQKFSWYRRHSFDPGSLLIPALPAAIIMADSPKHYTRDWRDGGAAFGRNFGDCLATELAANAGRYVAGTLAHEDPRYYPDRSKNGFHRIYHALAFTLIDRSDTGRPTLAISNLAGSAAAGFVGMAYLPAGYNDTIHAGQRASGTLGGYVPTLLVGYATGNLLSEFTPEFKWLGRKLHIPFVPKD
jgi:hypothetical protein